MTNNPNTQKTADLGEALRKAARELALQISDATAVEVETHWVEVGENGVFEEKEARLAAMTRIQLDGDTKLVIPTRRENGLLVRDDGLIELHLNAVQNAIEYRKKILDAIINVVRQVRER
jgi:hypothetical protein